MTATTESRVMAYQRFTYPIPVAQAISMAVVVDQPVLQPSKNHLPRSRRVREQFLIDATFEPVDILDSTDLSLLIQAREVTENLIDAMHLQVRESLGHQPRTVRKQARQQFLVLAFRNRPRINKMRKAIRQQLGHLKLNLASIDA